MASRTGRASVNPNAPRAFAICDRCGLQYNRDALTWQFDWAGVVMINRRILVCSTCLDAPQEQRRTIILPPDPLPIDQPRTEPYLVDEANEYRLQAPIGKSPWMGGVGYIECFVTVEETAALAAAIGDTGDIIATMSIGFNAVAAIGDTSDITADVTVTAPSVLAAAIGDLSDLVAGISIGFNAVAAIGDTGTVTADVLIEKLLAAAIGDTGSIAADVTVTGAGGDSLQQEDLSLLLLEDLNPIVIDAWQGSVTDAGTLEGTEEMAVAYAGVATARITLARVIKALRGY